MQERQISYECHRWSSTRPLPRSCRTDCGRSRAVDASSAAIGNHGYTVTSLCAQEKMSDRERRTGDQQGI
jgi:hypothetical protein